MVTGLGMIQNKDFDELLGKFSPISQITIKDDKIVSVCKKLSVQTVQ